jgi:hypothetical protein
LRFFCPASVGQKNRFKENSPALRRGLRAPNRLMEILYRESENDGLVKQTIPGLQ